MTDLPDGLFELPRDAYHPRAQVILLVGPSGSGKTALTRRMGLPSVSLDSFYRNDDEHGLPYLRPGVVDWDNPQSWDAARAVHCLTALCTKGEAEVPIYDMPSNRQTGTTKMELGDSNLLLAEGIFASQLIAPLNSQGLLATAICIARSPFRNGWFRLQRDLAEARKPVPVLLYRGARLLFQEPAKVKQWLADGCTPASSLAEAERLIRYCQPDQSAA